MWRGPGYRQYDVTASIETEKHIEDTQAILNVRTTLDHELLDDTVESRALVSVALLARGQSTVSL